MPAVGGGYTGALSWRIVWLVTEALLGLGSALLAMAAWLVKIWWQGDMGIPPSFLRSLVSIDWPIVIGIVVALLSCVGIRRRCFALGQRVSTSKAMAVDAAMFQPAFAASMSGESHSKSAEKNQGDSSGSESTTSGTTIVQSSSTILHAVAPALQNGVKDSLLLVDHATGIGSAEAQATVRYYARARRGDSGSPYSAESYAENRTPVHDTTVADGPARIVSRTAPSTLATDSPQEPPPPSSPWATDKEVSATFPKPSLLVGCSAAAKCQATRRAHQLKCTRA